MWHTTKKPNMWWVLSYFAMGVLSSVGLGTGVYTGTLVVFPMVAAESVQHDTLAGAMLAVLPRVVVWGVGTACGELPPYYVGTKIATGAITLASMPRLAALLQSATGLRARLGRWGSLLIFGMACYPNATFDACGLLAGMTGMSVGRFLVPTVLGKGLVKAPAQALAVASAARAGGWAPSPLATGYMHVGCAVMAVGCLGSAYVYKRVWESARS